ncbi:hypothetical protein ILYODFUR_029566, partial [Ilyodon furcidens]
MAMELTSGCIYENSVRKPRKGADVDASPGEIYENFQAFQKEKQKPKVSSEVTPKDSGTDVQNGKVVKNSHFRLLLLSLGILSVTVVASISIIIW